MFHALEKKYFFNKLMIGSQDSVCIKLLKYLLCFRKINTSSTKIRSLNLKYEEIIVLTLKQT